MSTPEQRAEWRQRIEDLTYSDAEVVNWCLELMDELTEECPACGADSRFCCLYQHAVEREGATMKPRPSVRRLYDPNHCTACGDFLPCGESWIKTTDDLPDALAGHAEVECCASGRCEVCTPGYVWGRDG